MFELHDFSLRTECLPAGGGAGCDHGEQPSTEGNAIRCNKCLCQLVMVPYPFAPGEFRLQWMKPGEFASRSLSWSLKRRSPEQPQSLAAVARKNRAMQMIDDCFGYIGVQDLAQEREAIARRLGRPQ